MELAWVLRDAACVLERGEAEAGGKALGLARLDSAGARVPAWAVISPAAFDEHLARSRRRDPSDLQAAIRAEPLDPELQSAVENTLGSLGSGPYAVRSSMVGEDSAALSYAGQLESYLYLHSLAQVFEAIAACWASCLSRRVVAYRERAGLGGEMPQMGVIVQRMATGAVSGVAFSAHPVTGRRDHMLITAAWGVGEGVVGGRCNTDEYTCTQTGDPVATKIADKDVALVEAEDGRAGCVEVEVTPERRERSCLSPAQLGELARQVAAIATALGGPQDIEWTLAGGQFVILQARPITALPTPENTDGPRLVFDNSNIQESYCGVTTPLTFSFAARAYHSVYTQTMRALGLSEATIRTHDERHRHLLGLVRGRVYYNIESWYRGLLLLPSFGRNKADMEAMMGLSDPVDFVEDQRLSAGQKLRALPRLVATAARLMLAIAGLRREVPRWLARFETRCAGFDRQEFSGASFSQLMTWIEQLDAEVLEDWHTPILNDFAVMIANGRLRRLVEGSGAPEPGLLIQRLLGGEEGIESTAPTHALMRMASTARANPALRQAIVEGEPRDALIRLQHYPAFDAALNTYLERYGDRCMGELELETISLREDPSFLIAVLRNYLSPSASPLDADQVAERERGFRAEAEQTLRRHLGPLDRLRMPRVLAAARSSVKHRENMRLARTRAFGLARDLYRGVGACLHRAGRLDQPRDVFYLTVEELRDYHKGRAVTADLRGLAALRKREFAGYEAPDAELPPRFETRGPVYLGNRYAAQGAAAEPIAHGASTLRGIGCCAGIVEAKARRIETPRDDLQLDGQILVAARTDPGWAPLFPTCGGIVVERGSTLSHSAVIARELGIPAIVGIPNLMAILADGEALRLDGGAGTLDRLDPIDPPTQSTQSPDSNND